MLCSQIYWDNEGPKNIFTFPKLIDHYLVRLIKGTRCICFLPNFDIAAKVWGRANPIQIWLMYDIFAVVQALGYPLQMLPRASVAGINLGYKVPSEITKVCRIKLDLVLRNYEIYVISQAANFHWIILISILPVNSCTNVLNDASVVIDLVLKSDTVVRLYAFIRANFKVHFVMSFFHLLDPFTMKDAEILRARLRVFRVNHINLNGFRTQNERT